MLYQKEGNILHLALSIEEYILIHGDA